MKIRLVRICALAHPYPDGSRLDTVVLQYDRAIRCRSVAEDTFAVSGRSVVRAYTALRNERTEARRNGPFVILELDLGNGQGRTSHVEFLDRSCADPMSPPPMRRFRDSLPISVVQKKPLTDAQGREYAPDGKRHVSTQTRYRIVEEFRQFSFRGLSCNLYIPKNIHAPLPLVLFLHDASACGSDPLFTLLQGNGAVRFADRQSQKKHPCFVLAPQIAEGDILATDDFRVSRTLNIIRELITDMERRYPVDPNRIYAAGQSMGCMAVCELIVRNPDLFAASIAVAGSWDPGRMAQLKNPPLWIFVSQGDEKAYPGMNAVVRGMERTGSRIRRSRLLGSADPKILDARIRKIAAGTEQTRYTVFIGSSVVPPDVPVNPGAVHNWTWPIVYESQALKDWLFRQVRPAKIRL